TLILAPAVLLLTPIAVLGFRQASIELPQIVRVSVPMPAPQPAGIPAVTALPARTRVQRPNPPTSEIAGVGIRIDQLKLAAMSTEVLLTVQIPNRRRLFREKSGLQRATGRIAERITDSSGNVIATDEDVIETVAPPQLLNPDGFAIYQKQFVLEPGR